MLDVPASIDRERPERAPEAVEGQADISAEIRSGRAQVIDRRVIVFGPAALAEAFDRVGRSGLTRSASAVTAVEMLPDKQAVRFHLGRGAEACEATASGSKLAALLIGFCLNMRFPLPAQAAKTLDVGDDAVSLWLTVSLSSFPPNRKRAAT